MRVNQKEKKEIFFKRLLHVKLHGMADGSSFLTQKKFSSGNREVILTCRIAFTFSLVSILLLSHVLRPIARFPKKIV